MIKTRSRWNCDVCKRPITAGAGYVSILAVSDDGAIGGYPQVATPDETLPASVASQSLQLVSAADVEVLGHTTPRIAFRVTHTKCDPDPCGYGYDIGVTQVNTLFGWLAFVAHVGEKMWMGKADVVRMLALWWENRGIPRNEL